MDVVYLFQHSKFDNAEIRISLRSVAEHFPWVRKVWVFGDRPAFLSDDTTIIEHVPWEAVAWLRHVQVPVRNFFLQTLLVALHPEVAAEFLVFCDDNVLLGELTEEVAKRDRVFEDLATLKARGKGLWKESLWRTYDWLKRLGYTGFNFETHTPTYFTKKRVFEAYRDLHDFVTEDRYAGMLAETAILNHAYQQHPFPLTWLHEEGLHIGIHRKPMSYDEIVERTAGKMFLNFDDHTFNADMQRFLAERFPEPCVYERKS